MVSQTDRVSDSFVRINSPNVHNVNNEINNNDILTIKKTLYVNVWFEFLVIILLVQDGYSPYGTVV